MADFTSEVLSPAIPENSIGNDTSFLLIVAVYTVIHVLIIIGNVLIYRHVVDRGITSSEELVDHVDSVIISSEESVDHVHSVITSSEESVDLVDSVITSSEESVDHVDSVIISSVESVDLVESEITSSVESVDLVDSEITSSVESVDLVDSEITSSVDDNSNRVHECTETNVQGLFPLPIKSNKVLRDDPVSNPLGSNLLRLNIITDGIPKVEAFDSSPQDQNDGLKKGSKLKAHQFIPSKRTIIVCPARQHERTNNPGSDNNSSDNTNSSTLGVEDSENTRTEGILRGPVSDSTYNSDPSPVLSSDIANQRTEESRAPREEGYRSDELSCEEQAPVDHSSEIIDIVGQPKYPDYQLLEERLQTFSRWPNHLQRKKSSLATAGFFSTGWRDCTRCFHCGGELEKWEAEDNPWIEHARWFPNCSFVIKNKKQSFVDLVQATLRQRQNKNLTPHQQRQVNRKQDPERQQRQQFSSTTELQGSHRTAVSRVNSYMTGGYGESECNSLPRYPEYADLASRVNTFQGTYGLPCLHISEAGFFSKDQGLLVCFQCGGHLYAWRPGDDPWIEHARWFPKCAYLKAKRGQIFIVDVQNRHEQEVKMEMANTMLSQFPQRLRLHTRRHNNLVTSNPQSPTVPSRVSHQVRPLYSADQTTQDNGMENVLSEYQQHTEPPMPQAQHQPRPSVPQAQLQPRPSVPQAQHQPRPFVPQAQQRPRPSVIQVQHQPRPSVAQVQHQPRPSVAQVQHQPRPSMAQAQHMPRPFVAQVHHRPRHHVAHVQHRPRPHVAHVQHQPLPYMIQAPENHILLSQSVVVEDGHNNPLRLDIISNRHTQEISLHRTLYSARVTRNIRTGQVDQSYPWDLLCQICQESAADVTFVPCGHRVCCRRCGRFERVCPGCHGIIDGIEQ